MRPAMRTIWCRRGRRSIAQPHYPFSCGLKSRPGFLQLTCQILLIFITRIHRAITLRIVPCELVIPLMFSRNGSCNRRLIGRFPYRQFYLPRQHRFECPQAPRPTAQPHPSCACGLLSTFSSPRLTFAIPENLLRLYTNPDIALCQGVA